MPITLFFTLLVIGLVGTYSFTLQYIKYLRGETKKVVRDIDVILVSIFFGGPALVALSLAFKEIRIEDSTKHHRMLISAIIISIIQIVIYVLLFKFGVIILLENDVNTSSSLINIIHQ